MSEAKSNPGYVDTDYLKFVAEFTIDVKERTYKLMQISAGDNVLDVGCGPATDTLSLAELVGEAGSVVGVDYDAEMVNAADMKAKEMGLSDRVKHHNLDATSLPFADNSFDSCRSERVFQHLSRPENVLSEMIRVTRPGGRVVIVDTDWGTMSVDIPEVEIERKMARVKAEVNVHNGYAGRRLYGQFKRHGLRGVNVELVGLPITDYAFFRKALTVDELERLALESEMVTVDELERWRKSLEKASAAGEFYAGGLQVIAIGTKP